MHRFQGNVPSCWSFLYGFDMLVQVYAFVAPKIIGGKNAPSPVGELGMVEMTQALELIDVCYEQVRIQPLFYSSIFSLQQCLHNCLL